MKPPTDPMVLVMQWYENLISTVAIRGSYKPEDLVFRNDYSDVQLMANILYEGVSGGIPDEIVIRGVAAVTGHRLVTDWEARWCWLPQNRIIKLGIEHDRLPARLDFEECELRHEFFLGSINLDQPAVPGEAVMRAYEMVCDELGRQRALQ